MTTMQETQGHLHMAPGKMRRTGALQAIKPARPRSLVSTVSFTHGASARASSKSAGVVVPAYRPETMQGPARTWAGFESSPSLRPGAEDHRQHPSLIGNRRVWPDGRVEAAA